MHRLAVLLLSASSRARPERAQLYPSSRFSAKSVWSANRSISPICFRHRLRPDLRAAAAKILFGASTAAG